MADRIPTGTAMPMLMTIAMTASCIVTGSRWINSSVTGLPVQYEAPRSPRTTPLIHVTYWVRKGLSSPI